MVMQVANMPLGINNIPGPTRVRGRNSDNRLIRTRLGWSPSLPVAAGIADTCRWIEQQVRRNQSVNA
jgi:nucleoside-diphosphate-sugar epimerase